MIGYDEQDDADWLNERRGRQTEAATGKYDNYTFIVIVELHNYIAMHSFNSHRRPKIVAILYSVFQ